MSDGRVTDDRDVTRDCTRDWNQYTLTGGSGAVLVTTVVLGGAGAQREFSVGFIYTLVVSQTSKVIGKEGFWFRGAEATAQAVLACRLTLGL